LQELHSFDDKKRRQLELEKQHQKIWIGIRWKPAKIKSELRYIPNSCRFFFVVRPHPSVVESNQHTSMNNCHYYSWTVLFYLILIHMKSISFKFQTFLSPKTGVRGKWTFRKRSSETEKETFQIGSSSRMHMPYIVQDKDHVERYRYPIAENRDDRLIGIKDGEMELTFLGTASGVPSAARGVSSIALTYLSNVYLIDCGEGTQQQLQKSKIKTSKISKVFVTHAHGDHSFGLPSLLCSIGAYDFSEDKVVDIYGPEGIRNFLRAALSLSHSRVTVPHRIHEFKLVPDLHNRQNAYRTSVIGKMKIDYSPHFGEVLGGTDIQPDLLNNYKVTEDDEIEVVAAPLQHAIPCVGYVFKEKVRPGKLRFSFIEQFVESQKDALVEQHPVLKTRGYKHIYSLLKEIKPNETFTFPDGTSFTGAEITENRPPSRKVVVLGDTCNSDMITDAAMDCNVLVHESTNAFFPEDDFPRYRNYVELEKETKFRGHSTPEMAGNFAASINAKQLILTHFSPRYNGLPERDAMEKMWKIERMARAGANGKLRDYNDIIAAWDFMSLPIPPIPNNGKPTFMTNTTTTDEEY
jgi:ribonuclease Z